MKIINTSCLILSIEFTVIIIVTIPNNLLILNSIENTVNSNIDLKVIEMKNIMNIPNHHNPITIKIHKTILITDSNQPLLKIQLNLDIGTILIEIIKVITGDKIMVSDLIHQLFFFINNFKQILLITFSFWNLMFSLLF